jgi:hypothetical protein
MCPLSLRALIQSLHLQETGNILHTRGAEAVAFASPSVDETNPESLLPRSTAQYCKQIMLTGADLDVLNDRIVV